MSDSENKSGNKSASAPDETQTTDRSVEWSAIAEAGGIHNWVLAELTRLGLIETVDTQTLSAKERKAYRARRDEERRVRAILRKVAWASYRRAHIVHLGPDVFYHDTPDVDRYDISDPEARRHENSTPDIADAQALATALELSIPRLRWLAYSREVDSGSHYHFWTVPKRDGGTRLISAPKGTLKAAQTWIARNITERLPVHGAAHGFVPGRSTVTNATAHAAATVVFKFDIRDFYPSVTVNRVKGLFRKAGYGEQVATLLALLSTEFPREKLELKGQTLYVATGPRALPQGAPTSPSITNALSIGIDLRLSGLAKSLGLRYTRYADDLTFSWHGASDAAPVTRLRSGVYTIIADEGFSIKTSKNRILRAGRRQKITGLVVNRSDDPNSPKARVPRKTLRQLRVALHKLKRGEPVQESLDQLRGWAAYVYMTDRARGRAMLETLAGLTPSS